MAVLAGQQVQERKAELEETSAVAVEAETGAHRGEADKGEEEMARRE